MTCAGTFDPTAQSARGISLTRSPTLVPLGLLARFGLLTSGFKSQPSTHVIHKNKNGGKEPLPRHPLINLFNFAMGDPEEAALGEPRPSSKNIWKRSGFPAPQSRLGQGDGTPQGQPP
ncbi:MAG: hypothetical protein A2Z88_00610 [Omnitrophica WOR_2 bacterium GWA2_47_8]|nr:MAG: hypothetical protein A2Z88_00610 [Omnitrophica WOR_2 bacterium GWA2_47_8]